MVNAVFATGVFAHSTGFTWDEALMVMAPIAAVAGVLFLANSRAKKLAGDRQDADEGTESVENPPT